MKTKHILFLFLVTAVAQCSLAQNISVVVEEGNVSKNTGEALKKHQESGFRKGEVFVFFEKSTCKIFDVTAERYISFSPKRKRILNYKDVVQLFNRRKAGVQHGDIQTYLNSLHDAEKRKPKSIPGGTVGENKNIKTSYMRGFEMPGDKENSQLAFIDYVKKSISKIMVFKFSDTAFSSEDIDLAKLSIISPKNKRVGIDFLKPGQQISLTKDTLRIVTENNEMRKSGLVTSITDSIIRVGVNDIRLGSKTKFRIKGKDNVVSNLNIGDYLDIDGHLVDGDFVGTYVSVRASINEFIVSGLKKDSGFKDLWTKTEGRKSLLGKKIEGRGIIVNDEKVQSYVSSLGESLSLKKSGLSGQLAFVAVKDGGNKITFTDDGIFYIDEKVLLDAVGVTDLATTLSREIGTFLYKNYIKENNPAIGVSVAFYKKSVLSSKSDYPFDQLKTSEIDKTILTLTTDAGYNSLKVKESLRKLMFKEYKLYLSQYPGLWRDGSKLYNPASSLLQSRMKNFSQLGDAQANNNSQQDFINELGEIKFGQIKSLIAY